MNTNWHPTEDAAKQEANDAELDDFRLSTVRVETGEHDFPVKWYRAVPRRTLKVWALGH